MSSFRIFSFAGAKTKAKSAGVAKGEKIGKIVGAICPSASLLSRP